MGGWKNLSDLKVLDCMEPIPLIYKVIQEDDQWIFAETNLLRILDDVRSKDYVLITEDGGLLRGIITNYDALVHFQKIAISTMYIEEIENKIKSFILASFNDEEDHKKALTKFQRTDDTKGKFFQGLKHYLKLTASTSSLIESDIDKTKAQEAYSQHFKALETEKEKGKSFDDLTLNEYIDFFLSDDRWNFFNKYFSLEQRDIRALLSPVRITRNQHFHFRGPILPSSLSEEARQGSKTDAK